MNAVIFYSNTGQSKAVAQYISEQLNYPLIDIEKTQRKTYRELVLVFPVICQCIPDVVKRFLKDAESEHLTVVATYGKMCTGNVLQEIQRKYDQTVIAAAYVPTRHAYVDNDDAFGNYEKLSALVEKIKHPSAVKLPRLYKNPFAELFPKLRSRMGLKIYRNSDCIGCDICGASCSLGAISKGVISADCIRCLRCVNICPNHALTVKKSLPLKLYLTKKTKNKLIIYV